MTRHTSFAIPEVGLWLLVVACASLLSLPALAQQKEGDTSQGANASPQQGHLIREVNNAIFSAPTLTIFDNIQYQVQGSQVILTGQVVSDTTRHDIEDNVKHIEGITNVVDQIKEFPARPGDVQLRRALYRAIYTDPDLEKYGTGAEPPIHILVEGGHVTLEGVVDNEMDKEIANTRALGVSAAFSVTNHLQVRHP